MQIAARGFDVVGLVVNAFQSDGGPVALSVFGGTRLGINEISLAQTETADLGVG